MIKLELGTHEEREEIFALAVDMHRESRQYSPYPIDRSKLLQLIDWLIADRNGCLVVARKDGQIIGMLWGYISELFFSRVCVAQDLLLYIRKDNRGGMAAARLDKYYEKWAMEAGAVKAHGSVSADIDNPRAERFYLGRGYTPCSRAFEKVLIDV